MGAGADAAQLRGDEKWQRHQWRYDAAREAGLNMLEAKLFADSDLDIGELRRLVRLGCPPDLIARLLL